MHTGSTFILDVHSRIFFRSISGSFSSIFDIWKVLINLWFDYVTGLTIVIKKYCVYFRDTKDSLDRTLIQLAELQGSIDKVKSDSQEVINKYKQVRILFFPIFKKKTFSNNWCDDWLEIGVGWYIYWLIDWLIDLRRNL